MRLEPDRRRASVPRRGSEGSRRTGRVFAGAGSEHEVAQELAECPNRGSRPSLIVACGCRAHDQRPVNQPRADGLTDSVARIIQSGAPDSIGTRFPPAAFESSGGVGQIARGVGSRLEKLPGSDLASARFDEEGRPRCDRTGGPWRGRRSRERRGRSTCHELRAIPV